MLHMGASEPGGCTRAAPALLAHLSLLFVLYSGAMLATSARLKWDPSTYVALREALPAEYRALCLLLPLAAAGLLALAHLALAALTATHRTTRRLLYLIYAVCGGAGVVAEVCVGAWAALRVRAWLASDAARALHDTLEVRERVLQLLAALERWHPLPTHVKEILQEAESDLPWNGYVAACAGGVLLAAQLAAVALALLARHHVAATTSAPATAQDDTPYTAYRVARSRSAVSGHDRALLEPGFR